MIARSFDSNILIDALNGVAPAQALLDEAEDRWISRLTWIEVLSKGDAESLPETELLLSAFQIDELTVPIAERAAQLRNERRRLKVVDAVIQASAQVNDRPLFTRNTKDFPPELPGIHVPYTV